MAKKKLMTYYPATATTPEYVTDGKTNYYQGPLERRASELIERFNDPNLPETSGCVSADQVWNGRWPDWSDAGRRVVFENADGETLEGTLALVDVGFNGEDEYPIWGCAEGAALDFSGAERWRFA